MCLAIPVRVTELIDEDRALVAAGNVIREINIALIDGLEVGDYVILHVGFALSKVDAEEAQRTLDMMEQGQAVQPIDAGEQRL